MVFNQYWAHEDPEVIVKLDLQQAVYRDNIGSWFMHCFAKYKVWLYKFVHLARCH